MSGKTYLDDMQEKRPEMLPDEITRELCVIDEYKPDELCDRQPGGSCEECWKQEMEEK